MHRPLAVCTAFLLITCVGASHFRGGTISWEHLDSWSNGVESSGVGVNPEPDVHLMRFSYRFGYRRDYFSSSDVCDDDMIRDRREGYADGRWQISGASAGILPNTAIICTTYDQTENWAYGYNSFETNITATGQFYFGFGGNAWIGGMAFGGNGAWSLLATKISFVTRSDTAQVNRPPSTFSSPVVRLQLGCPSTISIPWTDADNDEVTCRYAVGTECASICGEYQHFTLDEKSCTISYNGGGGAYLVPVALMLEDHPRQNILLDGNQSVSVKDSLSQIPLQFLVDIASTTGCNVIPTYPAFTVQENATISIPTTGTLNETLFAYPSAPTLIIIQFIVLGPLGVQNSGVHVYQTGIYATVITWTPDTDQSGDYKICYYAVDSGGKNGVQICFTVSVAAISNPCNLNNGGCSDICVPQGASSYCTCSLTCWRLTHDRKTCAPDMDITCSGESIDIYMQECASNRTVVAGTDFDYFTDKSCQSTIENSRHHLKFSWQECGTKILANPIEVQYATLTWIWEGEYTGSSIITRGHWREVPVTCSLPSTGNLTGSFVPILPLVDEFFPEDVVIEGFGTFAMFFEFYRDSTFTTAFGPTDYPLQVTVNDFLYFSLGAVGQAGLVFFTEDCVATARNSVDGTELSYAFIRDGCFLDTTLTAHTSTNAMENRFSMQAFEFENNLITDRQDADISIQCNVILCDAADNNTKCFKGCLPASRRKRSVDAVESLDAKSRLTREIDEEEEIPRPSMPQSPPQGVKTRFIFVVEEREGDHEGGESTNITNWILLGIGVLILMIAVIVAYVIMKRKGLSPATCFSPKMKHLPE